jgi:ribosome-binding factor A
LLQQNRKRIQGLVGRSVILKYTPQLRFVMDESVEQGNKVLKIMEELERTGSVSEDTSKH